MCALTLWRRTAGTDESVVRLNGIVVTGTVEALVSARQARIL